MPYLRDYRFEDDNDLSDMDNNILKQPRLSHSFRYSLSQQNEKSPEVVTAETYVKDVIKKNVKMRDFLDFYEGDYFGEGILNAYLRLLDVYSELSTAKQEHARPGQKVDRVKIFETNLLDEFNTEKETGLISNALDDELQDLFDHYLLIVPVFVSDFGGWGVQLNSCIDPRNLSHVRGTY